MADVETHLMQQKRQSLAAHLHERNCWSGVNVGLMTAGDDAQGVNAALRAVVRMGMFMGCTVTYIRQGFKGLVEGQPEDFVTATWQSTSDVLNKAGTYIKSLKSERYKDRAGRLLAAKHLVEHGIQHLIVVGGDGSLRGCLLLHAEWVGLLRELDDRNMVDRDTLRECRHLSIVCIPCSITNDLCGTHMCIGVDSALHRIVEATDNLTTTSSSTSIAFVLEVMGEMSGYLALEAGIICDASMVFIPEYPPQGNWTEELQAKVRDNVLSGADAIICIVSEGATDKDGVPITSQNVKSVLETNMGIQSKITVLGHFQRGGVPSAYDRLLGTRMGIQAMAALKEMGPEEAPLLTSIFENSVVTIPAASCMEATDLCHKCIAEKKFAEAVALKGQHFQHKLSCYNQLHSMRSSPLPEITVPGVKKIGIIRVGKSSVGQCWVLKSIVGYCQSQSYWPLVIRDGFEGFIRNRYQGLTWDDVKDMPGKGNACLGSSAKTAAEVGLERISSAIERAGIVAMIVIGGFPAFQSMTQIDEAKAHYKGLSIPMCLMPLTILNNIPGTDITVGSDTALNEIVAYCDKMRRAARGYKNCVFVVETTGHNCGYLTTVASLVCGADASYIKQEKFNVETLLKDAATLRKKMTTGTNMGLVLRSEMASENYTTDFIYHLMAEEGLGHFSCRSSTIGHLQVGGVPSALDRSSAICNGLTVAVWIVDSLEGHSDTKSAISPSALNKTVLSVTGSTTSFEPVSKLVAETSFEESLPLYMWWMELRPLLRVLSGVHDDVTLSKPSEMGMDAEMSARSTLTLQHLNVRRRPTMLV